MIVLDPDAMFMNPLLFPLCSGSEDFPVRIMHLVICSCAYGKLVFIRMYIVIQTICNTIQYWGVGGAVITWWAGFMDYWLL